MRVLPSGTSFQMQAVNKIVSNAKSSGASQASFVTSSDAVVGAVYDTYGKDAVKVTPSNSKRVDIRI